MKSLTDRLGVFIGADDLHEMAGLQPMDTGLKYMVWISPRGGATHSARIKVYPEGSSNKRKWFSVSVENNPEVKKESSSIDMNKIPQSNIDSIFEFVKLNKDLLWQYWNCQDKGCKEISTAEVKAAIKPVAKKRKQRR